ncbi:MAG: nicotinamide mononucleotide transporter [Fermentimonas sp.]|jgi:nicotinamide mononucleotide transporter|uniref:Nicotinamide riboside transporter PnuC n=1 Tax=Fermentimonas caenicola TaxID=1562970 RepID=A0A098C0F0_9BACT|nr:MULTISPECIES: nicotinamide riboside transporter PnuC [Lascolabacillus]MBP6175450.1 nicotinamide mononucleotide transporter [Fermentimonas sp.]MDI9625233.1 nicotinamide riboside transporter PnuC [Bacteroidota bacterium]TAH60195.1 MAG: nicotinamide riboside transporter PnuC [Fermentimonas caenicola]MBP6196061.1 nicotinamide mononucleotide transporter [Fermentimonas sp.]MBP7103542.1 nicotinamide mononucleotide transporter [Fermentimonas sp.]
MNWLELIAVILGILSVWYARKEKILVFPFGIANVSIYIYICFIAKLFANAGINIVYLISNIFGWYMWSGKSDNQRLEISKNTIKQNVISWFSVVLIYIIVFFILRWVNRDNIEYMESYLPWIDSFNTAFFLVATILMAVKKIENWLFWIIGDIISIPIFASQGLFFTSIQYTVFLILAILGWKEWRQKLKSKIVNNE